MTEPVVFSERPAVTRPLLIVVLSGWIDASGAAAAAMSMLDADLSARQIAVFDRDLFIDYRARRPTMEIRGGVNSRLVWPEIELKVGRDLAGRDILLLAGHEPDTAWNRFSEVVGDIADEFGVTTAIGLGAYPIATPHSRPARLSFTTADASVADRLPYLRSSIDVAAGVQAVLEHVFTDRGIEAMGLWAQVPHYVAQMTYPAATVALLEGLTDRTGLAVNLDAVRSEAVLQRSRIDELVGANPEHAAMVRHLEQVHDAAQPADTVAPTGLTAPPLAGTELPSADELAAELEEFLREQG